MVRTAPPVSVRVRIGLVSVLVLRFCALKLIFKLMGSMQMSMRKLNSHTILQKYPLWRCCRVCINFCILALGSGPPPVSVRVRVRVSVSFSYVVTLLRILFCMCSKLISIPDCAPSFELVRRHKYSERATATVAVKIADGVFCRKNSQSAILRLAVNTASAKQKIFQKRNKKLQSTRICK